MRDCVLVDKSKSQYKGNFHMHTARSWDSDCPYRQALSEYQSKGYQFCLVSDHEVYWDSDECDTENFIALSGVESAFIVPETEPKWICDKSRFTHMHVNLINDWTVGKPGFAHNQVLKRPVCYGLDSWQNYIDYCRSKNQLVIVNHPSWSRMAYEDLLSLRGITAFEVINSGCYTDGCGTDERYWDYCLSKGRRLLGLSGDDTHHYGPDQIVCGTAFTMLQADEFSRAGLVAAIKAGSFYASMGPVIHDMRIQNDVLHMEFSPVKNVMIVSRDFTAKGFFNPGGTLESIDWPIKDRLKYFRVELVDQQGRKAWSQPVFPGPWDGSSIPALAEDPHTPLPPGTENLQP